MKAVININMDNAAFTDNDYPNEELARILLNLSKGLLSIGSLVPGNDFPLYDMNGNEVGFLTIK